MLFAQYTIYMASTHTDMRKGVDGLFALVRNQLQLDPFSKSLFVFYSRQRNRLKILTWEGNGFSVYYKRLERGTFAIPHASSDQLFLTLSSTDLAMILDGVELLSVRRRPRWRPPARQRSGSSLDLGASIPV